uniref:Uncharacterized protein n=1 Tax=Tanacetum cinerariifolium TaxID=118510 RepID=A0A6L2LV20_TANCI|nr:hypothetical protein [Tanacetum cinerariifolium]
MAFMSTTFASRYPPTNNQLRTSSNLRNKPTIQDGRVTVQNVQGRQTQGYAGSTARGNATGSGVTKNLGTNTANEAKVVRCYKYQVLIAKLSAYDLDVLLKVPNLDTYQNNNEIDQSMQEMQYAKQAPFINESDIDMKTDSNVISYDQYLKETKNEVVQDTTSSAQQDAMIMYVIEEMSN